MTEEWRDIDGYIGLYQVSNMGNVRRLKGFKSRNDRLLTSQLNFGGYKKVALYKDNKRKVMLVHRLVATAFIENPNNYPEINHKDEDKTNNVVTNLEWCTHKYNNNYGTKKERQIKTMKNTMRIKWGSAE